MAETVSSNSMIESEVQDVDPRVKLELETLNFASTEINKLEREIDMARNKFRSLLSESSTRLNLLYKKLGKCVGKARPYYEMRKQFRQAECDLTKATLSFQRANSLYQTAKETVALAEERMLTCSSDEKPDFDSAWQEMMNHATSRFTESEKEKRTSEEEHQKCAAEFSAIQQKIRYMEKDIPRSINRSKPYFEMKDHLEGRLQAERQSVEDLQRALTAAKETYSESLRNLEAISEEIHEKRKLSSLPPRTPGVGAEAGSLQADMLSINLDTESLSSEIFPDECDVASLSSQDAILMLDAGSPSPTDPLRANLLMSATPKDTNSLSKGVFDSPDSPSMLQGGGIMGPVSVNNESDPLRCSKDIKASGISSPGHRLQKYLPENSTSAGSHGILSDVTRNTLLKLSNPQVKMENDKSQTQTESMRKCRVNSVTESASNNSSGLESSPNKVSDETKVLESQGKSDTARGRPKDRRVQKLNPSHFPILQGLSDTNKRMSPKLPHARPKGQEIVLHHSPSPVRKANSDYFEYPEPKLRNHGPIAREVSPGPNLFPDSDTSLFQKRTSESVPQKITTPNDIKMQQNQNKDSAVFRKKDNEILQLQQEQHSENDSIKNGNRNKDLIAKCHKRECLSREGDGKEDVNTNHSNNICNGGDGVTKDGKVFYNV